MQKIIINDKEYPCQMTMGAVRRFKNETGKEVSEIGGSDVSDLVTLIWCCVVSACNAKDIPFDMDLEKFADSMDLQTVNQFFKEDAEDDKKKDSTASPKA